MKTPPNPFRHLRPQSSRGGKWCLVFGTWSLSGVWCLVFGVFFTGCAGYKLGPTNGLEAGARTIQINPPVNQTLEPRLAVELNQQLRKQLQRDGTYRLETRGEGDVIVSTTILACVPRVLTETEELLHSRISSVSVDLKKDIAF